MYGVKVRGKPISVPNRFGINGKEKSPFNVKLHIYFLSLSTTLFRSASFFIISCLET